MKFFLNKTLGNKFLKTKNKTKQKTPKGTIYKIMESLTKYKEVKLQAVRKEYGFRNV